MSERRGVTNQYRYSPIYTQSNQHTITLTRQDSTSNVKLTSSQLFRHGKRDFGNVNNAGDSRRNQTSRNGLLLHTDTFRFCIGANRKTKNDIWNGNKSTNHGKGVLQAHNGRHEDGDLFICYSVYHVCTYEEVVLLLLLRENSEIRKGVVITHTTTTTVGRSIDRSSLPLV